MWAQAVVTGPSTPGVSMPAEPALAPRGPAAPEESAIQLVQLTDVWPPLDREPAAGGEQAQPGHVQPPAADPGPVLPRQLRPWMSKRGAAHLQRLMPLFKCGQQPKVLRVLTSRPAPDVIEMTMVVVTGPRTRALAIRLEHAGRWLCTDIEAA